MSSQINRPQGYSINWSDTSQEQQGSDESLSEYGMLRKELLSRYPDNEPLKVYIQHFEELFIIEDSLNRIILSSRRSLMNPCLLSLQKGSLKISDRLIFTH